MTTAAPPDARDARPRLSERHNAMLRAMGVNVWWDQEAGEAAQVNDTPVTAPPQVRPPASPPASALNKVVTIAAETALPPIEPTHHVSATDLDSLNAAVRACQRCDLGRGRRQAVPGTGDLSPDWLIVGEAPGEEEDRQGEPFVGRAGQLLDRMLNAMHLSRAEKVYIANVIKCRPPQNRNPSPAEVTECSPYLMQQVALLRPRIVLAMGRFAAQSVLGQGGCLPVETLQTMPLGKLRGQVYQARLGEQTLPVIVTYHPAYLLRNPADKAKTWTDLCLAMRTLQNQPAQP